MYDYVNEDGYRTRILDSIERHRSDNSAINAPDDYFKDSIGQKSRRVTTKGYDFLVNWRDGSESWIKLSDIKESNPLDVAEYALENTISKEPAFSWWTPHALKKWDSIISATRQRDKFKDKRCVISISKNIKEAYAIDWE